MEHCNIQLPYGETTLELTIPERNLLEVYSPVDITAVADIEFEVKRALNAPIGSLPLGELVKDKKKIVIVADDNTRPTPTDKIIPILLNELNQAGIADQQVTVMIALGTHRPMTDQEIMIKFGREIVKRVKIINHDYKNPAGLVDLGQTRNGTPITVNKLVYEADFKLGVGSIVPHHIPGFAGGAKIVQPGVCGEETTGFTHLLSTKEPRSLLGIEDNPVRRELNEIARQVGLHTIFNTVLDRHGRVIKGFFGDVEEAFNSGVKVCKSVYRVSISQEADIVLASSHPCDIEFWQAHKTLYACERVVKQNGVIIVVTPCPEGIAKTHSEIVEYAGLPSWQIKQMHQAGKIADPVAAALGIAWAQVRERARVYLVAGGISDDEALKIGFTPFKNVMEALHTALNVMGEQAKVAVLTHAPDTLPIVEN